MSSSQCTGENDIHGPAWGHHEVHDEGQVRQDARQAPTCPAQSLEIYNIVYMHVPPFKKYHMMFALAKGTTRWSRPGTGCTSCFKSKVWRDAAAGFQYRTFLVPKLFGTETYRYWNFLALKHFCTETFQYGNFLVRKLFGTETFQYRTFLVQKLFGTETLLYWNFLVLKLYCAETFWYWNFTVLKLFGTETLPLR